MAQKVLIVEDDASSRRMMEVVLQRDRMLRYQKLEVLTAADGEEGLALFEEERPDVVVTDLLMPKVDGFKLIETLRAREEGKTLPILAVSGVIREQRVLRDLEHRFAVEVQLKPFSPRVICERVKRLLARAKEVAQPGGPLRRELSKEVVLGVKEAAEADDVRKKEPRVDPRAPRRAPESPGAAAAEEQEEAPAAAGEIGEPAVARLLLQLFAQQLSGRLELERVKVRKIVYVLSGHPIFVQSNIRSETLGQLLVRRGGITEEQHRQALAIVQRERIKYGEALVRMGLMTESDVMDELKRQTLYKVQSCLRWREGRWAFYDDATVGTRVPQCTVAPVEAVFSALSRPPNAEGLIVELMALGSSDQLVLSTRFRRYAVDFASVYGPEILQRLSARPRLAELLYGPGADRLAAAVDTLLICGLATLQPAAAEAERPAADDAREEDVVDAARQAAAREAVAPTLEAVAAAARGAAVGSAGVEQGDFEALLNEAADEREREPEPAGAHRAPRISTQVAPVASRSAEEERIARALIEAAYLGLHEQSYYEVLGVIPETDRNGIEVAYKIKRGQFDVERFRDHDLGEAFGHLEEICSALDRAFAVLRDPQQRAVYDEQLALAEDGGPSRAMEAERLYQAGLALLKSEQYAEAEATFDRAVQLDDQPDYRAQGAWAHFLAAGESIEAAMESMVRVQAALEKEALHPGSQLVAARISRSIGAPDEALEHLRGALSYEPGHQAAFDELHRLLVSEERYADLEREYRKVLHHLRGEDPRRSAQLWKRLVLLYRDRLGDAKSARKACDAAFRLNPDDDELRTILFELDANSPEAWPKSVLGYRALLRSDPRATAPIVELFRLHKKDGRLDAALIAAQAAALRGVEDDEIRAWRARHDDGALHKPQRGLDAAGWRQLRHPDEDLLLTGLFALLTPLIEEIHPLRPVDLDLNPGTDQRLAVDAEIMELIQYACRQLALDETPEAIVKPELAHDIRAAGTTPPVVLIGSDALALDDRREVLFRLVRSVALLRPGYKVIGWRDAALLQQYLVAVVGLFYPDLVEADELVLDVQSRIAGDEKLLDACRAAVQRIHDRGDEIDFSRWMRGVTHTAERVALLLCGDLAAAGRVVAEASSDAERALLDFALGAVYAQLRVKTGLALSE